MAIKDLRRTDLRGQTLANPVWLTSAEIDATCDDAEAVLFSFPKPGSKLIILNAVADITEAFAGGTVACTVGSGTIATDNVDTGGTLSVVDADDYLNAADLGTMGTVAVKPAIASDLGVAILANTLPIPARLITGADSNVPCIYAALTSSGVITAGKFRVKLLVTSVDGI